MVGLVKINAIRSSLLALTLTAWISVLVVSFVLGHG
jgi:hypothetical protein